MIHVILFPVCLFAAIWCMVGMYLTVQDNRRFQAFMCWLGAITFINFTITTFKGLFSYFLS